MYINNLSTGFELGQQSGFGWATGFPTSQVINYSFVPTSSGWRGGASFPAMSMAYTPAFGWQSGIQTSPFYNIGQSVIGQSGLGQPVISGFSQPFSSWQFPAVSGFGNVGLGTAYPQISGFTGLGTSLTNAITSSVGMIQPRIDIAETNSDVVVTADLPNINPANLQLTVTDDSLSISALALSGNMSTSVHRTVALPCPVRAEHVDATYSNGILEARLPKSDIMARRRVKVNVTG